MITAVGLAASGVNIRDGTLVGTLVGFKPFPWLISLKPKYPPARMIRNDEKTRRQVLNQERLPGCFELLGVTGGSGLEALFSAAAGVITREGGGMDGRGV